MWRTSLSIALLLTLAAGTSRSDEPAPKPGDATLGAKPPAGAIVLLGNESLEGWVQASRKVPAKWPYSDGILTVGSGDIMTEKTFGNFELHVEFNVPYMPDAHGQGRGNSGVYLAGNHELQVLDSYGLKSQDNDCGAIYKQVAPAVNACKPPLQWQTYDITFHKAAGRGRQGREEGPRDRRPERRQDHRRRRDLADTRRRRQPRGEGRPAPAPGPRQPRPISEYLDQADLSERSLTDAAACSPADATGCPGLDPATLHRPMEVPSC